MQQPHMIQPEPQGSNPVGLVGFILSVVGLLTCVTAPIGLIVSLFGLPKKPNGFAVAGVVTGAIGTLGSLLAAMLLVGIMVPAAARARSVAMKLKTSTSLRTVWSAVQQYELQEGVAPESLEALVDAGLLEVSSDPTGEFTDAWGTPIVYEVREDGSVLLYSLGMDGVDGTGDEVILDAYGAVVDPWDLEMSAP